jgi:uncharacterized protein (TIGR00661 family)
VSDYEPSVARAAHELGVPLVSVDNQHRFVHAKLSGISWPLKLYAFLAGQFTEYLVPDPDKVVISCFHSESETDTGCVRFVPGILREAVESAEVSNEGFLLVYARPSVSEQMLSVLERVNCQVRVYGSVAGPCKDSLADKSNFTFCELSPRFVDDLAHCSRLISTAGHQLLAEARFFQKPVLVVPEPMQYEQYINAWYAEQLGMGVRCRDNRLSEKIVFDFLEQDFQPCVMRSNGAGEAAECVLEATGRARTVSMTV